MAEGPIAEISVRILCVLGCADDKTFERGEGQEISH